MHNIRLILAILSLFYSHVQPRLTSVRSSCLEGEFSPSVGVACAKCPPGSFAESNGSISCSSCAAGFYQPSSGQSKCIAAPKGSYVLGVGASTFQSCPAGTFNDKGGQSSSAACRPCAAGSFSSLNGSKGCSQCAAGSYASENGSTGCYQCPAGKFASAGSTGCSNCSSEFQYSNPGSGACSDCPHGWLAKSDRASCADNHLPPNPLYKVKERTFLDKKPQWFYCYDETARPPPKIWWEVWNEPATNFAGVTLAGEGMEGNRTYSNITFVMDKHVHQVLFTCNSKNDVGHKKRIINLRFESTDYDPLRLKIIVDSTYDLLHKTQSDSLSVVDKVHAPMDQFDLTGEGYRDTVIILCHMTGSPYGTDLELVHDDPTSPSDVPYVIRNCIGMKQQENVVYCTAAHYKDYVDYKWECRAKQKKPDTNEVISYAKKLQFIRVPSKIKIRFQYYSKWYDYEDRYLRFRFIRGGVALIRCDASYYENGRLTEIPFPHQYDFFIIGQDWLPHYAKQSGNNLTLSDIPQSLHGKEIVCFVRPQNRSEIAVKGIGQRYFKITVFTMPEKPNILVTMEDRENKSKIIRNPGIVELRRNGPATELTCTLQNHDPEVDRVTSTTRYLDWVKCKNYECNYADADQGSPTRVSSMEKKLEGNKAVIRIQTGAPAYVRNSGIFMCVAVRPFVNVTGDDDLQLKTIPVKVMVQTKPGEGDDSRTYGMMNIQRTASGDIEFDCFFTGLPYPDLEITRHNADNRSVTLVSPKWNKEYEGPYFDDMESFRYGSQLKYKLPKENLGPDAAKGLYVCSAKNSLGTAEAERVWNEYDSAAK